MASARIPVATSSVALIDASLAVAGLSRNEGAVWDGAVQLCRLGSDGERLHDPEWTYETPSGVSSVQLVGAKWDGTARGAVACATDSGDVFILDAARDPDDALVSVLGLHDDCVSSMSFLAGSALLVTASWDGTAALWDSKFALKRRLGKPTSCRRLLVSSCIGDSIVLGGEGGLWLLDPREEGATLDRPAQCKSGVPVTALRVNGDSTFVTGTEGGAVSLWDVRKLGAEPVRSWGEVHRGPVTGLGGVVSAGADGRLCRLAEDGAEELRVMSEGFASVSEADTVVAFTESGVCCCVTAP
jgi:WD40 repeat protein